MARRHGRNGRVYVGTTTAAAASMVNFVANWSLEFSTDKEDVTAMGDSNKVKVAGLPDVSGELSGFWDDATAQTITAALDGLDRAMYIYPDITNASGVYYSGRAFLDFSTESAVDGAVEFSSEFDASGTWTKTG